VTTDLVVPFLPNLCSSSSSQCKASLRVVLPRYCLGGARSPVLRQNSVRTENSAIPCYDGCLIQVIPSPSNAKNLSAGNPSGIPVYIRMEEPGRFHDATLVRIRQPDRTGGAALPVAPLNGPDPKLRIEFCRQVSPSQVRDACGPHDGNEHTRRAIASDGVHSAQQCGPAGLVCSFPPTSPRCHSAMDSGMMFAWK